MKSRNNLTKQSILGTLDSEKFSAILTERQTGNETQEDGMKSRTWDILSIIGLISICVLMVVFVQIAMDPNSSLNPFPPPTMPAMLDLPTSTPTLRSLPATWTATPLNAASPERPTQTLPPSPTGWVMATFTSTPTNTPTRTNTPTVTKTPTETRKPTNTQPPSETPLSPADITATHCAPIIAAGTPCP